MSKNQNVYIRFWSKTKIKFETGCIEWTGGKDKDGYGFFKLNKIQIRAHRASLNLAGIETPSHLIVCHKCDNPSCVNPNHLFLGTTSDNMKDCVSKNRQKEIRKTHCPKRHPLFGDNLYVTPAGKRHCRSCTREGNKKSYMKRREHERV